MRWRPPHLDRRLVLAQALIDDLAEQIVVGPVEKFDLGDARVRARTGHGPFGGDSASAAGTAVENCRRESRIALRRVRYDQVIPVFLTRVISGCYYRINAETLIKRAVSAKAVSAPKTWRGRTI
jgi:hypothetical protein